MATHLTIHDELTGIEARDVSTGAAALEFTFSPTVYGNSFVGSNSVTMFFRDATLAHRIQADIVSRLKERQAELNAAELITAEAAE